MRRFLLALVLTMCVSVGLPLFATKNIGVLEVVTFSSEIDESSPAEMHNKVDAVNDDPRVKVVLLEMNSPGGGVYASAELRDEIARIKVPVIAYCRYWCASGGYYAITAPNIKGILVGRGTLIGSIGVIRGIQRQALPENGKLFKSGRFKQAGNVLPAVPGEDESLQRGVDEMAQTFYDVVAQARGAKISDEAWVRIKDAEVFDGPKGVELGLADQVVSRDEAVQYAKLVAGSRHIYTRDEIVKRPFWVIFDSFR